MAKVTVQQIVLDNIDERTAVAALQIALGQRPTVELPAGSSRELEQLRQILGPQATFDAEGGYSLE